MWRVIFGHKRPIGQVFLLCLFTSGTHQRDPWAETPAMWLEVYRWYDAWLLGPRNLLLERRAGPRFTELETIGRFRMAFTGELRLPVSSDAVFWTMKCGYSMRGQLQKALFRVPGVLMSVHEMSVHEAGGFTRRVRVIPEVLVSPVLGNYLPSSLSQFYAVFPTCEVEILRPAR